jgi:hypothetical protein
MTMNQVFDDYVCDGEYIVRELDGFKFCATLVFDDRTTPMDYDEAGCCFDTSDPEYGEENKEIIASWKRGEWFYVGIVISVEYNGVLLDDHIHSVWGYEANFPNGDNSYLTEEATRLMEEALDDAKKAREEMIARLIGKAV